MPWKEVSRMACRREFVMLALEGGRGFRELCRRFGVSPTTGYAWVRRFRADGDAGLVERSHRPAKSPRQITARVEKTIVQLRKKHSAWGARKLRRRLEMLGRRDLPCASTFHAILLRHGLIDPQESAKHRTWQRFEHEAPNQLWQMDFKGHFATERGGRCHPLTVLDDHSRFAVGLRACVDEKATTVQEKLTAIFRCYGLPDRITMDNGSPWGSDVEHPYTPVTVCG
jgi:transposase InsO family protein